MGKTTASPDETLGADFVHDAIGQGISQYESPEEFQALMLAIMTNDEKKIDEFQRQNAERMLESRKHILELLWSFYLRTKHGRETAKVNGNTRGEEDEEKDSREPLSVEDVKNLIYDFLRGCHDSLIELQRPIFEAIWGPLKPVCMAQGMHARAFDKKRNTIFNYCLEKGARKVLTSIVSTEDEHEKLVNKMKRKENTVTIAGRAETVEEISWDDFFDVFGKSNLFKDTDANLVIKKLVPLYSEGINSRMFGDSKENK